jgi:GrpB-like predicted nucleotidyltransferase (UPF0157 family)
MREFGLPPTDLRYKETPFEVMEFLFVDFLNNFNYEERRINYIKTRAKQKELDNVRAMKSELVTDDMGYTRQEAEEIIKVIQEYKKKQ